jgi:PAS domain S-box-containing protein
MHRQRLRNVPVSSIKFAGILLVILYFCLMLFLLNSGIIPIGLNDLITRLGQVLPAGALIGIAIHLRRNSPSDRKTHAWSSVGLGVLFWLGEDFLRFFLNHSIPGTVMGSLFFGLITLAGYSALLAGFIAFLPRPKRTSGWIGTGLEIIISTIALTTIASFLYIKPILGNLGNSPSTTFWAAITPLMAISSVIILVDLMLLNSQKEHTIVLILFALGLTFLTANHIYAASQALQTGSIDLGYINASRIAGYCLMVIAGFVEMTNHFVEENLETRFVIIKQQIHHILPLASTIILVCVTLFSWQLNDLTTIFLTSVSGLCLVLLILRQGVAAGESEQAKFAILVNSLAEPTFISDMKGNLQLANPAFYRASGYRREDDLTGRSLRAIISMDKPIDAVLRDSLLAGWSGEVELQRHDGSSFPAFLALRPMQWQRTARKSLAGTAHDLTETKHQQETLQKAYEEVAAARAQLETFNTNLEQLVGEKTTSLRQAYAQLEQQNRTLQSIDEMKTDFVSMVSHELRAPLTNINSGIELVLDDPSSIPEKVTASLGLVQAEILRLNNFVETILDVSALDAGHAPFYSSPISLGPVISAVQRQMAHLPGAEHITWILPDEMPFVIADERALNSVFVHLLDNALKYARGSPVEINISPVAGKRVEVSITDCGPGIQPDALPLIFDKFYRPHKGDAQVVYGHGLGLYIVRRLLQIMGSDVSAENRPTGGARFVFWLNLVQESDELENPGSG